MAFLVVRLPQQNIAARIVDVMERHTRVTVCRVFRVETPSGRVKTGHDVASEAPADERAGNG